jgi:hypothetical protein
VVQSVVAALDCTCQPLPPSVITWVAVGAEFCCAAAASAAGCAAGRAADWLAALAFPAARVSAHKPAALSMIPATRSLGTIDVPPASRFYSSLKINTWAEH